MQKRRELGRGAGLGELGVDRGREMLDVGDGDQPGLSAGSTQTECGRSVRSMRARRSRARGGPCRSAGAARRDGRRRRGRRCAASSPRAPPSRRRRRCAAPAAQGSRRRTRPRESRHRSRSRPERGREWRRRAPRCRGRLRPRPRPRARAPPSRSRHRGFFRPRARPHARSRAGGLTLRTRVPAPGLGSSIGNGSSPRPASLASSVARSASGSAPGSRTALSVRLQRPSTRAIETRGMNSSAGGSEDQCDSEPPSSPKAKPPTHTGPAAAGRSGGSSATRSWIRSEQSATTSAKREPPSIRPRQRCRCRRARTRRGRAAPSRTSGRRRGERRKRSSSGRSRRPGW